MSETMSQVEAQRIVDELRDKDELDITIHEDGKIVGMLFVWLGYRAGKPVGHKYPLEVDAEGNFTGTVYAEVESANSTLLPEITAAINALAFKLMDEMTA